MCIIQHITLFIIEEEEEDDKGEPPAEGSPSVFHHASI